MAIYRLKDIVTLNDKYKICERIKYLELAGITNFETTLKLKYDIPSRAKWYISKDTILIGRVRPLNKNHNIYRQNESIVASSGFTCFKSKNDIVKNDYLWYILQSDKFYNYTILNSKGSTYPEISQSDLLDYIISIPAISFQQEIIDIIEPIEKLFLKYSKLVRIDTVENCKKDVQNLIDIIEPIEKSLENIRKQKLLLKRALIITYQKSNNELVYFSDFIKLHSENYKEQIKYIATNAIGEFTFDEGKSTNITSLDRPSRANLSPIKNSLIISKLDGENKLLYIDSKFEYVVSTGFFNVTTNYLDHVVGFLLSQDFIKQKTLYSTGTTMVGINNKSLSKILFSKPNVKDNYITLKLNNLIKMEHSLNKTLNTLINLLIK